MKKEVRLSENDLIRIVKRVISEQPNKHPMNHPFFEEMISNIEGDNVELVSFTTNKLVIDAFGNIYTITKQPNTRK